MTSAYDLLSKPTLELTDEEVEAIVADLRVRRNAYVTRGKKDDPKKPVDKQQATADLMSDLGL